MSAITAVRCACLRFMGRAHELLIGRPGPAIAGAVAAGILLAPAVATWVEAGPLRSARGQLAAAALWMAMTAVAAVLAGVASGAWRRGGGRVSSLLGTACLAGLLLAARVQVMAPLPFEHLHAEAEEERGPASVRDARFEARAVGFVARVVGMPRPDPRKVEITARVVATAWDMPGPLRGGLALVRVDPGVRARHGDLVAVRGTLTLPQGPGNPGEFNYRGYLLRRGIGAVVTGDIGPPPDDWKAVPRGRERGVTGVLLDVRGALEGVIERTFPAGRSTELALLRGILFGDTSGLPARVLEEFRDAGVYHILAVSGSNVAFLVAAWYALFQWLWWPVSWWRRAQAVRVRASGALVIVAAYAVMTGGGPSVMRASVMAGVWLAGQALGYRPDAWNSLAVAATAILMASPLSLFDPGFQLSFAATAGILLWTRRVSSFLPEIRGPLSVLDGYRTITAMTLAAQLATWPITAWHFGRVPVLGLPANTLVVPVAGWLVTGGVVAGVLGLALPVLGLAVNAVNYALAWVLVVWTQWWAAVPACSVDIAPPSLTLVATMYLATATLLRPVEGGRSRRQRVLVCLALAAALATGGLGPGFPARGHLVVTFLDVGQGEAVLLRLPDGGAAMIDTGGPWGTDSDVFRERVRPMLRRLGIRRLNWLLVTHGHDDHDGGLASCLNAFPVGMVLVPAAQGDALVARHACLRANGAPLVRAVSAGQGFVQAGVRLDVLWPRAETPAVAPAAVAPSGESPSPGGLPEANASSLVVRLTYRDAVFLFTADIGMTEEEALVGRDRLRPPDLRADILKVAHHGSAGSSGLAMVERVGAQAAIVSVGKNLFGHPAPEAIARLAGARTPVWRTDRNGAITVRTDGRVFQIDGFRPGGPAAAPGGR